MTGAVYRATLVKFLVLISKGTSPGAKVLHQDGAPLYFHKELVCFFARNVQGRA